MPSNATKYKDALARPLKTMHGKQYRSDQTVLLVMPFDLGFCVVYGAADLLLNMVLHDVSTVKFQVVGMLNRRRNADNCVRYLLYFFAPLIIFTCKAFLYLHQHSKTSFVPSMYFWTCNGCKNP